MNFYIIFDENILKYDKNIVFNTKYGIFINNNLEKSLGFILNKDYTIKNLIYEDACNNSKYILLLEEEFYLMINFIRNNKLKNYFIMKKKIFNNQLSIYFDGLNTL